MSTQPRQPHELNHVRIFDEGAVKSRLNDLTAIFVSELATEEMRKINDKAKRQFKTPPVCDWSLQQMVDKYEEQAQKEAQKVLEQERLFYVDSISENIKRTLTQIAKQLRFMVWSVDENEKPYKLQIIVEKAMKPDYRGNWDFCDTQYVGEHDFERLRQIGLVSARLDEFRDYAPYFNEDLKKLWSDAHDLAHLETVRKGEI